MTDPLVLALDTATDRLSVAVLRLQPADGGAGARPLEVLAERGEVTGRATSARLLPVVEAALDDAGLSIGALGAVVVGVGPGTFTGVRIAVAAARAVGLSLDVPVLGVSTLAALASEGAAGLWAEGLAAERADLLVPVVDARRGQVFAGLYFRVADGRWARRDPYRAVSPEALEGQVATLLAEGEVDSPVLLGHTAASAFGAAVDRPGAPWVATVALDVSASRLVAGQERLSEPLDTCAGDRVAPVLADLVRGWTSSGAAERAPGSLGTPESVVPLYVRPPDADEHILRMRDPFAS